LVVVLGARPDEVPSCPIPELDDLEPLIPFIMLFVKPPGIPGIEGIEGLFRSLLDRLSLSKRPFVLPAAYAELVLLSGDLSTTVLDVVSERMD
jgi:hypothetical protein